MKVSHVLFKSNDLKKTFKEFEKSGFKVEYGSKTKPHNALIYFSEGPTKIKIVAIKEVDMVAETGV